MRVLHPVTQRETLVASGLYRYARSGVMLKGEERFSIHALPDGSWFVRVDYDWRALDGTSQLIEALIDPLAAGGRFQRVVAQLHRPAGISKETMDFHAASVLVGAGGGPRERRDFEITLPEGYAVLLLKTTLVGIAAARWPQTGETLTAFCGYRSNHAQPLIYESRLTTVGEETLTVGGKPITTQIVDMEGEFNQRLWLDTAAGIAIKRETGELTVTLHDYLYRPQAGA